MALVAAVERDQDRLRALLAAAPPLCPAGLEPRRWSELWRCGIRAFGAESAADFPVIAERAGDPEAWDFYTNRRGRIQTWQDHDADDFLDGMPEADRAALTAYTAGWSPEMNRAVTGDEPPPVDPEARAMADRVVAVLTQFDVHARADRRPAATVLRGVPMPPGWGRKELFDTVYPVGARVDLGQIASTSHNTAVALEFAEEEQAYIMVIQSRAALPIRSVSANPTEDESILGPAQRLRVVHVDPQGQATAGRPAVYLVAEDLVAAEQARAGAVRASA
ncbi:ADP-ribosyltransferase domain-containing protein [Mycolicibacterium mageritense]|uniref:ADP-ribosyltransferase domain-containing protein n=1 Tax=Mycolicibacterium mageritense TaxID=53462 RepID=UPI001E42C005|nr:ADP-ribosyltransferase domain-containing protein [Mycolicibacterium mageritense]MCC9182150.1 hypothetical protein [Mycolicibacterium mageritense]